MAAFAGETLAFIDHKGQHIVDKASNTGGTTDRDVAVVQGKGFGTD